MPTTIFSTLRQSGVYPVKEISFRDHKVYKQQTLKTLIKQKEYQLVMTEKDAVKCHSFAQKNWWYVPIDALLSIESEKNY